MSGSARGRERLRDARESARKIAEHQLGLEVQHVVAEATQRLIAARIGAVGALVIAAIDLDDEASGWGQEVGYETPADRHLTAERSAQAAAAKGRPQELLGGGGHGAHSRGTQGEQRRAGGADDRTSVHGGNLLGPAEWPGAANPGAGSVTRARRDRSAAPARGTERAPLSEARPHGRLREASRAPSWKLGCAHAVPPQRRRVHAVSRQPNRAYALVSMSPPHPVEPARTMRIPPLSPPRHPASAGKADFPLARAARAGAPDTGQQWERRVRARLWGKSRGRRRHWPLAPYDCQHWRRGRADGGIPTTNHDRARQLGPQGRRWCGNRRRRRGWGDAWGRYARNLDRSRRGGQRHYRRGCGWSGWVRGWRGRRTARLHGGWTCQVDVRGRGGWRSCRRCWRAGANVFVRHSRQGGGWNSRSNGWGRGGLRDSERHHGGEAHLGGARARGGAGAGELCGEPSSPSGHSGLLGTQLRHAGIC